MAPDDSCKNFVNGQLKGSCASAKKYESNMRKEAAARGVNNQYERVRCKTCPADINELIQQPATL